MADNYVTPYQGEINNSAIMVTDQWAYAYQGPPKGAVMVNNEWVYGGGGSGSKREDNYALISRRSQKIAHIIPDCVVEESHDDRLQITSHPVESGAEISDHAFKQNMTIEMRIAFSDSTPQGRNNGKSVGQAGRAKEKYDALVSLQATREPFTVSTSKRMYRNMLVSGIIETNDARSRYTTPITLRLQEVRITNVLMSSSGEVSAPPADQANPETTAPQHDAGNIGTIEGGGSFTTTGPSGQENMSIYPQGSGFSEGGVPSLNNPATGGTETAFWSTAPLPPSRPGGI